MKEQQKAIYRSMQGKEVDMNKLMNQNELTVAVGNVKVNARGDELGPGGKIIRKKDESVVSDQHIPDEIRSRKVVAEAPNLPVEQVARPIKTSANRTDQLGE
jgi:hypothetical protein